MDDLDAKTLELRGVLVSKEDFYALLLYVKNTSTISNHHRNYHDKENIQETTTEIGRSRHFSIHQEAVLAMNAILHSQSV